MSLAVHAVSADPVTADKHQWQLPHYDSNVQTVPEGQGDRPCIKIITPTPDSNQQIKHAIFYGEDVARIVFSGRMKTENVHGGSRPVEKCRAQPVFRGIDGTQLGGWPASIDADGTTPWTAFHKEYPCPPGTRVIDVWLGLFLSAGTGWFDGLDVTAYDAAGHPLKPGPAPKIAPDVTTGWITFDPGTEQTDRPLVVDFAAALPAPAGQFGFVTVKDSHLAFANGQRAHFWGTGFVQNWNPPKDQAVAYANAVARAGMNIVRLHGMDALNPGDTIFDQTSDKTDRLDPAKMDRLDYLIAELKKRGVYIDLNLTTKRRYLPGDGVPEADKLPQGGKQAAQFDQRLIELQKDYARLLLTHVNPYTGVAYKDEPAIAVMEMINESSFNFWASIPPTYMKELDSLFSQYCTDQHKPRPPGDIRQLIRDRDDTVERFIEHVDAGFFSEMDRFLKQDMGVHVPISGTQYNATAGEMRVQATLDLIDHHDYWDHPSGGWDPMSTFTNKPMVKLADKHNVIEGLEPWRVRGKPFMVSEWNFAWPNEFITEGPTFIGAYAGLNDWDAAMIFGSEGLNWQPQMANTFDAGNKPQVMLPLMTMALGFYRGDVTPGEEASVDLNSLAPGVNIDKLFTRDEMLTKQCVLTVDGKSVTRSKPLPVITTQPTAAHSGDGQINWTSGGVFTLNTPRTQAVVGFTGGLQTVLKDATVTMKNDFGQLIFTSLTNDPIATSPRVLLCAMARAENTNQTYRTFRTGLESLGKGPILLQPVEATITLPARSGVTPTIHLVDFFGRRTEQTLKIDKSPDGSWAFTLGDRPAGWFEIEWSATAGH